MTDVAEAPFVARKEYFGCLVYDRKNSDYIPFDREATEIFELSLTRSGDEIYREIAGHVTRQSFDTFMQLCSSIELFRNGTFQGVFINADYPESKHLTAPTMVYLQTTRYCNLACKHCWADAGTARPRELTILEVRDLLDQMSAMGCYKLQLGGGEPLGRGDWYDIIKYANDRGIVVSIATNATMATKAVAAKLGELKIDEIKVSLEAASEKSYDYIRSERAYRKAIRGIKNLKELTDAPIYFHTVLQRDNLTEIPALVKQAEKFKVDRIVFDTVVPVGRAKENPRLLLTPEEANNALDLARRIGQTARVEVEVRGKVPPPYQKKRVFEGFGSEDGRLHCHISSEGVVSASGFVSHLLPAGNLREKSLKEIWESGHGFKVLRTNPGNNICKTCDYFRSCRGGSRSRTYATLGALTEPDPLCLIAKEKTS
ncbi:MAG: radical SAM protein [Armatimonadetes bacterium]|nr:radical SAM protein [Armatimonadota bacterium]